MMTCMLSYRYTVFFFFAQITGKYSEIYII